MHGVPADLDLDPFLGATLDRIDLGLHIIHLRFEGEQNPVIGIEGDWELRDEKGL
jgi:hypothetical protein